ncbi:MAG: diguanylate cyclase [Rubrivivax sp.]
MKADARHSTAAEAAIRAAADAHASGPQARAAPNADAGAVPSGWSPVAVVAAVGSGALAAGTLALGLAPLLGAVGAAATVAAVGTVAGLGVHRWVASARLPDSRFAVQGRSASASVTQVGAARPLFLELSAREWSRARRYGTGAALLLIEVDRHEMLQQTCGAAALDRVVDAMLQMTAPSLRGADVLTRYSPVQMAVFLAQADALGALDVAERIRERAERLEVAAAAASPSRSRSAPVPAPVPLPVSMTVSIGVATLRPSHTQLQSLIDDAALALAAARTTGGNCVRAAPVEPAAGGNVPPGPGAPHGDRRLHP